MALVLGVNKLLGMTKNIGGLHLIAVCKVFFRFISCSIVLQLQRLFQKHLSPHQFGISTLGACETILFGIRALFNLHLDWILMQVDVETVFNSVSRIVIFKEL
jgi:hypothetical protein